MESDARVICSFRPAFQDSMKEADSEGDLRYLLMGRQSDRLKYG